MEWLHMHMTLGNTVPLARTFSKCAATDKAFNSPPTTHSLYPFFVLPFSAELLKNFFSANVLWLESGKWATGWGGRLPVVFAANKQQGATEKKEFKGGEMGKWEMAKGWQQPQ